MWQLNNHLDIITETHQFIKKGIKNLPENLQSSKIMAELGNSCDQNLITSIPSIPSNPIISNRQDDFVTMLDQFKKQTVTVYYNN